MKDFILEMGEKLLGLIVIVGMISAGAIVIHKGLLGLLTALAIMIGVVSTTFFLYLLIDIRDKNVETNDLLKKLIEQNGQIN